MLHLIFNCYSFYHPRADSLAPSAKKQTSFVVYMDAELPIWFTEST